MKKVHVSHLTESTLDTIRQNTAKKIRDYLIKHKGKTVLNAVLSLNIPLRFLDANVYCEKCGHCEAKASYAIAQKTMGHTVTFNCKCGNNFEV